MVQESHSSVEGSMSWRPFTYIVGVPAICSASPSALSAATTTVDFSSVVAAQSAAR